MKTNIFLGLSLLIFVCCKRQMGISWQHIVKNDISEIQVKNANMDILPLSEKMIHAKDFWVCKDSVLVVLNKPTADHFVEFYNINSEKCYAKVIRKGNGPREMLNCDAYLRDDVLCVCDFVKSNYVQIAIDEIIEERELYELSELSSYKKKYNIHGFRHMGDRILYLNPFCFGSESHKIYNNEPRFFYDNRRINVKEKYYAFNVSQGHIEINDIDSLIVFASLNTNEMEIYDFDLKPIKKIEGPTKMHINYCVDEKNVVFENASYGFMGLINAGNTYWATYQGQPIKDIKHSYVLQYDWTGKLINGYYADKYLSTLTLSLDGNILYLRGNIPFSSGKLFQGSLMGV